MAGDAFTMADIPDRLRDAPLARSAAGAPGTAAPANAGTRASWPSPPRAACSIFPSPEGPPCNNAPSSKSTCSPATPYRGNPLAVVLDGTGLSDEEMQHFARWTNLSETTFLLPPDDDGADYRVRIFTPGGELPFAGHPTLGSCHAWLEAGGKPRGREYIVQECEVGLVKIRREKARLAFAAPPLKRSAPSPAVLAQVAAALGLKASQVIAAQILDNGPAWLTLLLDSPQTGAQAFAQPPRAQEPRTQGGRRRVRIPAMQPAYAAILKCGLSPRRSASPKTRSPAA